MISPGNILYFRKNYDMSRKFFVCPEKFGDPSPLSPTILEREILTSRCSVSAKFALITRQNLFTPLIQRGLATPLVVLMMIAGEFALLRNR